MSGLEPSPSRQLYLNSRNASYIVDSTKMSRMTFSLNEPLVCPKNYELYASIVSCEIPNTLFTVETSSTFVFNFFKSGTVANGIMTGGTLAGTITFTAAPAVATVPAPANTNLVIPIGNYSGSTAPATLATYLSKTTYTFDATTITFVTSYSTATSRFQIAWSSAANVYGLQITNAILGFSSTSVLCPTGTGTTLNTPQVATTVPRLFPNYLLIATNLNTYNQAVGQSKISALGKIVIDVPFNSWIYFRNWFLYSTRITNREIGNIELSLYDEFGNEANLNGANFSITLQIDTKRMITTEMGTGNF